MKRCFQHRISQLVDCNVFCLQNDENVLKTLRIAYKIQLESQRCVSQCHELKLVNAMSCCSVSPYQIPLNWKQQGNRKHSRMVKWDILPWFNVAWFDIVYDKRNSFSDSQWMSFIWKVEGKNGRNRKSCCCLLCHNVMYENRKRNVKERLVYHKYSINVLRMNEGNEIEWMDYETRKKSQYCQAHLLSSLLFSLSLCVIHFALYKHSFESFFSYPFSGYLKKCSLKIIRFHLNRKSNITATKEQNAKSTRFWSSWSKKRDFQRQKYIYKEEFCSIKTFLRSFSIAILPTVN